MTTPSFCRAATATVTAKYPAGKRCIYATAHSHQVVLTPTSASKASKVALKAAARTSIRLAGAEQGTALCVGPLVRLQLAP